MWFILKPSFLIILETAPYLFSIAEDPKTICNSNLSFFFIAIKTDLILA